MAIFRNVPEEQQWTQVKAAVQAGWVEGTQDLLHDSSFRQEKLPAKVNLWHVSQVNDKNDARI